MEHRCGARHPVRLEVEVVTPGGQAARGILRDFSTSGVFVETNSDGLRIFMTVELRLMGQGSAGPRVQPAVAMVVRVATDGVALLFDSPRPPLIEACMCHAGPTEYR